MLEMQNTAFRIANAPNLLTDRGLVAAGAAVPVNVSGQYQIATAAAETNNMAIPFIKEANAQFYKALPGMCTSLSYDYINGYLYVNSNGNPLIKPLGHIVIESPFEIPTEIPRAEHLHS